MPSFHSLIHDIKDGKIAGFLYTIELQKRGLPHTHIIVFIKPHAKLHTPEQVDSLMSSELPVDHPELLELVKKFMIHGSCDAQNENAPCIENKTYTKGFPKPFSDHTSITENSYARIRHLNTGQTFKTGLANKYQVNQ